MKSRFNRPRIMRDALVDGEELKYYSRCWRKPPPQFPGAERWAFPEDLFYRDGEGYVLLLWSMEVDISINLGVIDEVRALVGVEGEQLSFRFVSVNARVDRTISRASMIARLPHAHYREGRLGCHAVMDCLKFEVVKSYKDDHR